MSPRFLLVSILLTVGCASTSPTAPSPPLTQPKTEAPPPPEIPDAGADEQLRFERVGQLLETSNGVSVELLHGFLGKMGETDGAPTVADVGLAFSLPGHPTQVTSGAGHFYVFGRPVEVEISPIINREERRWDPGRGSVRGTVGDEFRLNVRLGKSQPVPDVSLEAEIQAAVSEAQEDGLELDGYSWRSDPMLQGQAVVVFRTVGDDAGISLINLVTGRTKLTRFSSRTFPGGRPPAAKAGIEPLRTVTLESEQELPLAVRAREASFRQCLRATLVPVRIDVVHRDGTSKLAGAETLDRRARGCLEEVARQAGGEGDRTYTVVMTIDFRTVRYINGREPAGTANLREAVTVPSDAGETLALLKAYHAAVEKCATEKAWQEAPVEGTVILEARVDDGAVAIPIPAVHDTESLATIVPCLQGVFRKVPFDTDVERVRATYSFTND